MQFSCVEDVARGLNGKEGAAQEASFCEGIPPLPPEALRANMKAVHFDLPAKDILALPPELLVKSYVEVEPEHGMELPLGYLEVSLAHGFEQHNDKQPRLVGRECCSFILFVMFSLAGWRVGIPALPPEALWHALRRACRITVFLMDWQRVPDGLESFSGLVPVQLLHIVALLF